MFRGLPLIVELFRVDKLASNLKRADVLCPLTARKVGMISRQQYQCKGGIGVTFKAFAVLQDGVSLTFAGSVSLNGGEVTKSTEHSAISTIVRELLVYVTKHGVPNYRYEVVFKKAQDTDGSYWVVRHDGYDVCCWTRREDADRTAKVMNDSQCQWFTV